MHVALAPHSLYGCGFLFSLTLLLVSKGKPKGRPPFGAKNNEPLVWVCLKKTKGTIPFQVSAILRPPTSPLVCQPLAMRCPSALTAIAAGSRGSFSEHAFIGGQLQYGLQALESPNCDRFP